MSWWQSLSRWLSPAEIRTDETFSLGNRGETPGAEQRNPERLADVEIRAQGVMTHIDNLLEAAPQGKDAVKQAGDLTDQLDENTKLLKQLFHAPANKDLVVRELTIATRPPAKAVVCFMDGLSDKVTINNNILQPLMLLSHLDHHVDGSGEQEDTGFSLAAVKKRLLPGNQISEQYDMKGIAQSLLSGDTVVLFDGLKVGLAVETKALPARSVGETKNERVVWGAQDAFVEAMRVNIGLVRKRLKDPRVVTEILNIGTMSNTYVAIMYIRSVTSPKLLAEVKRRIQAVKVDTVNGAGILEQYIEDSPRALMPGTLITERPDRTAAYLAEGHVAILLDNSPQAVITPITFWAHLQTSEDYYLRWPFGTLLRYLRLGALLLTLFLPAVYIAVINYHQEMIPTELMLFIAQSRESVPMPALVELLLMDMSFELIREAGIRIPNVIGPTIGLVASLILGQAAVSAKIVSPVMIIVVALTGLASFAVPNYLVTYAMRALRFLLVAAAAFLGFYGIAAVSFVVAAHLAAMRSFGVPYLSPVAPTRGRITDVLSRPPLFEMEFRPDYTRPLDDRRQAEVVRSWDPYAPDPQQGNGQKGGSPA